MVCLYHYYFDLFDTVAAVAVVVAAVVDAAAAVDIDVAVSVVDNY